MLCLKGGNVADSGALVKVALVAAVGYVAYEMGWLSAFGLTPPAAAATPATPTTTTPVTTTTTLTSNTPITKPQPLPSLATVQAQLLAAANASAAGYGVDQWGFFLNQVLAPYGLTAPDPAPLFSGGSTSWDRSTLYPAAAYWAVMAPALTSQSGLSGLGAFGALTMRGW